METKNSLKLKVGDLVEIKELTYLFANEINGNHRIDFLYRFKIPNECWFLFPSTRCIILEKCKFKNNNFYCFKILILSSPKKTQNNITTYIWSYGRKFFKKIDDKRKPCRAKQKRLKKNRLKNQSLNNQP